MSSSAPVKKTRNRRTTRVGRERGAPKRGRTAYQHFQRIACDENFVVGGSVAQVGQKLSALWSRTSSLKEPLGELAAQDAILWAWAYAGWRKEKGTEATPTAVQPKTKRAKRDPNAPKKPLSAWICFLMHNNLRPGAEAGQQWRALSPQQRVVYEEQAAREKERFKRESAAYTTSGGAIEVQVQSVSVDEDEEEEEADSNSEASESSSSESSDDSSSSVQV